jgi:Fanconi anemia group J protein
VKESFDFECIVSSNQTFVSSDQCWVVHVGFWCLNPAVTFKYIRNNARSVIVTSATLTPSTSFSSELDTQFAHILHTNHIINFQQQLRISVVSSYENQHLTVTFKQLDDLRLQDALGESVLALLCCIPQGVLCFFPSYG